MRNTFGFSQYALLERAAACDRTLEVVVNPEIRAALKQLREVWVELAEESPTVLREEFANEILLLSRLQAEIAAAGLQ